LAFKEAVDVAELLFLTEADRIFGDLAARLRTMLARRIVAALERLGGAKQMHAKTAADAGGRTCVTSHGRKY